MAQRSYKTECPKCGKDNFYVTPRNGMGYCFSPTCHYVERDGKAYTGKERVRSDNVAEIRALYYTAAHYYHSALNTQARNFLHARGFTDETIKRLLIRYCPVGTAPLYRSDIAKEAGLANARNDAFLANRITFPYFKTDKIITDIRARALDPHDELKYKSPFGDVYYRGAIYPYNYNLARGAKRILITEGEIKADIAVQAGFPTIALPGISAWRVGFAQEENQEVVIVFDNESNPNTQREVIAAVRKVAGELVKPKIAVLPIMSGQKKAEIDTFVNMFGVELFRSIIDNALTYEAWNVLQTF